MSTLFMSSNAVHSTISMKFLDWHHRISQQLSLSACPSPPASHQPTPRTGPAPPQGWYSCSPSSGRTARSTGANPTSSQQKSGYFLILPGMVQLSVSLDQYSGMIASLENSQTSISSPCQLELKVGSIIYIWNKTSFQVKPLIIFINYD